MSHTYPFLVVLDKLWDKVKTPKMKSQVLQYLATTFLPTVPFRPWIAYSRHPQILDITKCIRSSLSCEPLHVLLPPSDALAVPTAPSLFVKYMREFGCREIQKK